MAAASTEGHEHLAFNQIRQSVYQTQVLNTCFQNARCTMTFLIKKLLDATKIFFFLNESR